MAVRLRIVMYLTEALTFRVTVQDAPSQLIMKLEGKVVGPWVTELRKAWIALAPLLSTKKLALDLCGVTFVDEAGLGLLREIHKATQAEMITSSPLTRYFADRAQENGIQKGK